MTTEFHPTTAYRACVDPLHRNIWPVRVEEGDDAPVIGYLTEHITVNLDGTLPPHVDWSWKFDGAEANELRVHVDLRYSLRRYPTWRKALAQFASIHQLATALRQHEAYVAVERAKAGE